MEFLQVVRRQERRIGTIAAIGRDQGRQEQGCWLLERELDRKIAGLFDDGRSAVGVPHPAGQGWRQILVQENILVPEQDVIGRERRAIGPFGAFAQRDRPDLEVGRGFGSSRDLGFDLAAVRREAEQRVEDHADVVVGVGRAEEGAAPHTAILTDGFDRNEERLFRQPQVDGRQLAGPHLLDECCRLLVFGRLRICTGDDRQPCQQPEQERAAPLKHDTHLFLPYPIDFFPAANRSPARIPPLHGPTALAIIPTLHDSGSNTQCPN